MNPNDVIHVERLCRAVEVNRDRLAVTRRQRKARLDETASTAHNEDNIKAVCPIPLMALFTGITTRRLINRDPRVLLKTRAAALRPEAAEFQEVLNRLIKNMRLGLTLRRAASAGLFGPSVIKVGLDFKDKPFAEPVDLDDWVHDLSAPTFRRAAFYGDWFRMPLDEARECKRFKKSIREKLKADLPRHRDERGNAKAIQIAAGLKDDFDGEIDDAVTLLSLYLPRENQTLVIPWAEENRRHMPLCVDDWDGPERGPYEELSMGIDLPGSSIPIAPATPISQLAKYANHIWQNVLEGAREFREWYTVRQGSEEDVKRLQDADTRTFVPANNPDGIQKKEFGVPNQAMFALGMQLIDQFSWAAGNMNVTGGLAPGSGTLGQDRILSENASQTIQDYQQEVLSLTQRVIEQLAEYRWGSSEDEIVTRRIPGIDIDFISNFGKRRSGEFSDYDIEVRPYSLTPRSPSEELQVLTSIMREHVYPNLQFMLQRGTAYRPDKLMDIVSKLADSPFLDELFEETDPIQMGDKEGAGKPAETTRNYVRESKAAAGNAEKRSGMIAQMMAAGQGKE